MTQGPPDDDIAAVRAALDLAAIPSRRRELRCRPLPDGVSLLLRIAADDFDAVDAISKRTQCPPDKLRKAASFYIEQILLEPNANSYRVLGASRDAATSELRRNLAYLCRWLHSEICEELGRSVFVLRVTRAWNDLKTTERRAVYDAGLDAGLAARRADRSYSARDLDKEQRAHGDPRSTGGDPFASSKRTRTGVARKRNRVSLWRRFIAFARGVRP